jgi:hypothetical protein
MAVPRLGAPPTEGARGAYMCGSQEMLAARLELYVKRGNTKGWPTGAAVPSTPTTRARRSSFELVDRLLAAQNNGSL